MTIDEIKESIKTKFHSYGIRVIVDKPNMYDFKLNSTHHTYHISVKDILTNPQINGTVLENSVKLIDLPSGCLTIDKWEQLCDNIVELESTVEPLLEVNNSEWFRTNNCIKCK